jgi:hypothetical protein
MQVRHLEIKRYSAKKITGGKIEFNWSYLKNTKITRIIGGIYNAKMFSTSYMSVNIGIVNE